MTDTTNTNSSSVIDLQSIELVRVGTNQSGQYLVPDQLNISLATISLARHAHPRNEPTAR